MPPRAAMALRSSARAATVLRHVGARPPNWVSLGQDSAYNCPQSPATVPPRRIGVNPPRRDAGRDAIQEMSIET